MNLGLIPSSESGWQVACEALRPVGGILHVHSNVQTSQPNHQEIHSSVIRQTTGSDPTVSHYADMKNGTDTINADESHTNRWNKFKKTCPTKEEWAAYARDTSMQMENLLQVAHSSSRWTASVLHIEHVKSYAPHIDHIVVDIQCRPHVIEQSNGEDPVG